MTLNDFLLKEQLESSIKHRSHIVRSELIVLISMVVYHLVFFQLEIVSIICLESNKMDGWVVVFIQIMDPDLLPVQGILGLLFKKAR